MTTGRNTRGGTARRGLTALAATALAGALALSVSGGVQAAPKTPAPGFLAAKDMPQAPGNAWNAGAVTAGAPESDPFCLDTVLPAQGTTWHRQFHTDLDTGGVQVSVRAANAAAAEKLAARAGAAVAACAADWLRTTPGGTASWDDYGTIAVEEGARVVGVAISIPDAGLGVHLLGVGRDGDTVTIVSWGRMGKLSDAPVAAFKKTTTTAVNKLR
ncbi:hypothetical protein OG875_08010 [Streptomyces sp. NBC_01498]|uniref:hypothetical protein n=1 Tax=Streptomyces sp. NBC_01498 TaxID=2975870 RepID=UPI002E7C069C|nr:hypothetical protein [Streptomyces sp. NBC_01498]WTL24548.1 hypothetical protein OG875_08010 [Streptomyces sp. NBC_01498]